MEAICRKKVIQQVKEQLWQTWPECISTYPEMKIPHNWNMKMLGEKLSRASIVLQRDAGIKCWYCLRCFNNEVCSTLVPLQLLLPKRVSGVHYEEHHFKYIIHQRCHVLLLFKQATWSSMAHLNRKIYFHFNKEKSRLLFHLNIVNEYIH